MRGNAIGQVQEGGEPTMVGLAEVFDLGPVIQTTEDGTDGDDQSNTWPCQPSNSNFVFAPGMIELPFWSSAERSPPDRHAARSPSTAGRSRSWSARRPPSSAPQPYASTSPSRAAVASKKSAGGSTRSPVPAESRSRTRAANSGCVFTNALRHRRRDRVGSGRGTAAGTSGCRRTTGGGTGS